MVHFSKFVDLTLERKNRYHHRQCLNCGYKSQVVFHYCPRCGQENISIRIPFWDWLYDLTQNAFAVDSKIVKSFVPFLFKPGFLTLAFNTGHRASYVNPFRLYLIMSLVLFTITAFDPPDKPEDAGPGVSVNETIELPFGVEVEPETTSEANTEKKEANKSSDSSDFPVSTEENKVRLNFGLNPKNEKAWEKLLEDTALRKSRYIPNTDKETDSMIQHYGMSDHFVNRTLLKQGLKALNETESLNEYAQSKLPSTIFFMLPFYTMFVQLIYRRRKFYYQEHLVHTFNIHSFSFFLISVLYFVYLMGWVEDFPLGILLIVTMAHVYFSLRTVYLQSHFKTLLKFCLLGTGYILVLTLALMINIAISFLLF